MSQTTNPFSYPEEAALEVVLEMIRVGKIIYAKNATDAFTAVLDHFRSEQKRIAEENKSR